MLINWMREKAPLIMGFVLVAFILTIFVSWGAGGMDVFGGQNVGRIDGEAVSVQEFSRLHDRQRQYAQDLTPEERRRFPEQVWKSLIAERIREELVDDLGLEASDSDAKTLLLEDPDPRMLGVDPQRFFELFGDPNTGELNLQEYHAYVQQNKPFFESLAQDLKYRQIPLQRLTAFFKTLSPSPAEQEFEYRRRTDQVLFEYLRADLADFSVTPQDLSSKQIRADYERFQEQYAGTQMASLAVLRFDKEADEYDRRYVREDLADIAERVRREDVDFAEEARFESDNRESAENGGYLGALDLEDHFLPEDVATVIADLSVNEVSDPMYVEGSPVLDEGYHIFTVLQKHENMVQLGHIYKQIQISPDREMDIDDTTAEVFEFARRHGFDSAAVEYSITPDTTGYFGRGHAVPIIDYIPELGRFSFDEDINAVGDFYDPGVANYVVVLLDRKEAQRISVDEYLQTAFYRMEDSLRYTAARTFVEEAVAETATGESFLSQEDFSDERLTTGISDTTTIADYFGRFGDARPAFAAMGAPTGDGIAITQGAEGSVYAVLPLWKSQVEEIDDADVAEIRTELQERTAQQLHGQWGTQRKKTMSVEDNLRRYFY
ncbi:peptidylprolyl isomerase [Chitinivibrio alkaliphilus]|uniref:Periplasmic chaperone PpiD n=1 Tax=Chitinivibrio alkaliphilus ACht1 TaxID=1313304 RepID=U7DA62_9BACT|nr:SurA N-terminal domain-containing protein [Chitinivibrio alkaliphilus]ERP32012.1 PpiC-type peptidyl-prolyl cis-trans isomerase [Chitinivibrio alkaliphilus ACht1]